MRVEPVGTVSTPFETTADAPRQGFRADAEGEIRFDGRYAPAMRGIGPGDSVDVLWWADRADRSVLRLDRDGRGVFASRSPARPNPVCVTRVEAVGVDAAVGRLRVRGVDMADGSPVIDVKAAIE